MEKIDLSTNSKKLQGAYDSVVQGDGLTTYAVFEVTKSGVADVSNTGSGSLDEFIEEFHDGQVQFGFVRVTVPGSDVFKNILLGWCPDNAPLKLRTLFAANFAEVARIFSGYHIQITARDTDDLDPEEFLSRVGAAAGARYTFHASNNASATPSKPTGIKKSPVPAASRPASSTTSSEPAKPKVFGAPAPSGKPTPVVQPAFGAKPSFGAKPPIATKPAFKPAPKPAPKPAANDDGWGEEKEIEERDFTKQPLEDVPSAYKPTKVNIEELRSQKSDTISSVPKPNNLNTDSKEKSSDRIIGSTHSDGRLSSLPKPKTSNNVASRYKPTDDVKKPEFGSKPAFGSTPVKKEKPEGVYQIHGNENGLTPAQAWAQKRGKYKIESNPDDTQVTSSAANLSLNDKKDEEDEEEEEEEEKEKPEVAKPVASFPPKITEPILPRRDVQPVSQPEEEELEDPEEPEEDDEDVEDEEQDEDEETDAAAAPPPTLPSRSEPAPALPSRSEPAPAKSSGPSAVAQYDYEKDEDNEVEFVEGDIIVEIDFVDEEWWAGKNSRTGESGVFPASYVALEGSNDEEQEEEVAPVESKPAASEPAKPKGQSATAEYDYDKEEDNEISFKEGDVIVEIDFIDSDWWSGKHSVTGEVGVFPGNYVKLH